MCNEIQVIPLESTVNKRRQIWEENLFETFLKVYFKLLKCYGEDWRQKLSFVSLRQIIASDQRSLLSTDLCSPFPEEWGPPGAQLSQLHPLCKA